METDKIMSTIYASFAESKTGLPVPLYKNGHAAHSRYDPVREAETIVAALPRSCNFFLLVGFGAGYIAKSLLSLRGDVKIFAVEKTDSDIEFLKSNDAVASLLEDSRVTIVPLDRITDDLQQCYLPAIYGDLQIVYLRSWCQENPKETEDAQNAVKKALSLISADYSVQAHFGAIWQRNIVCNLRDLQKNPIKAKINFPVEKTAFVVAAGPSLEKNIGMLVKAREKFFVISTDTAYGVLRKKGIAVDAVVSIDAQNISATHFLSARDASCAESYNRDEDSNTLFVFDATSSPSSVRYEKSGKKLLITTGHPLVNFASDFGRLQKLHAGAGTVTIAAADFAYHAGFNSIVVAGADFAYLGGKSYSRGTYLDALYYSMSDRTNPAETKFDALLFRSELLRMEKGSATTAVLESYKNTLVQWAQGNSFEISKENDLWVCSRKQSKKTKNNFHFEFDYEKFRNAIIKKSDTGTSFDDYDTPFVFALLPYIAWLRSNFYRYSLEKNTDKNNISGNNFSDYLQLAYKSLLMYT